MTLNEYQTKAMSTLLPTANNLHYMLYNLQAEVGELTSIFAKAIRDGSYSRDSALKELGDVLWQVAGVCHVLDVDMETVAKINVDKLAARKAANTLGGAGDDR